MAGLYIHIPFCKKACHYCDFHFSTSLRQKDKVLQAICSEIELRKNYLKTTQLETIYFGGGTPSTLSLADLKLIFSSIEKHFTIKDDAEITLEANPDDLTTEKLIEFKNSPINRLSIGIQSFREEDLKWMNRAHNAQQALDSVKKAQKEGFDNITIDLIYGIPELSNSEWKRNLEQAFQLNVQHISAYCLTVESGTSLGYDIEHKKAKDVDENIASQQFEIMLDLMIQNDFEQYEISNFAKDKKYSKHNSNYWNKSHYLGIGPSAHSYNGCSREWNIANNKKYTDQIMSGLIPSEREELDHTTRYNEYILTGLRTKWGISISQIKSLFGEEIQNFLLNSCDKFISSKLIEIKNDQLILTSKGKLFADKITSDLFFIPD